MIGKCEKCKRTERIHAKNLCMSCYNTSRINKRKENKQKIEIKKEEKPKWEKIN